MFQENLRVQESKLCNPKDGTHRLSYNVGKKLPYSLYNNPGEHSSQLLQGGSVKSCIDKGCSRMGAEENEGQEKNE
jgi:hypothetical protein